MPSNIMKKSYKCVGGIKKEEIIHSFNQFDIVMNILKICERSFAKNYYKFKNILTE